MISQFSRIFYCSRRTSRNVQNTYRICIEIHTSKRQVTGVHLFLRPAKTWQVEMTVTGWQWTLTWVQCWWGFGSGGKPSKQGNWKGLCGHHALAFQLLGRSGVARESHHECSVVGDSGRSHNTCEVRFRATRRIRCDHGRCSRGVMARSDPACWIWTRTSRRR